MLSYQNPAIKGLLSPTGYKNFLINGSFLVNRRRVASALGYSAERWITNAGTGGSPSTSINLVGLTPTGLGTVTAAQVTFGSASTTRPRLVQVIESGVPLMGRFCTLSFWASATTAFSLGIFLRTRGSFLSTPEQSISIVASGATPRFYSATFFVPVDPSANSSFSNVLGAVSLNLMFPLNTNTVLTLALIQLELGTLATPFENRPRQQELALCNRYFQAIMLNFFGSAITSGSSYGTPVQLVYFLRAHPTVIALNHGGIHNWNTTGFAATPGVFITQVPDSSSPVPSNSSNLRDIRAICGVSDNRTATATVPFGVYGSYVELDAELAEF